MRVVSTVAGPLSFGRALKVLALMALPVGLSACASSLGSFGSSASLAYQGPETASVQREVRQSLETQQKNLRGVQERSSSSKKLAKKLAKKDPAPVLDALEARDLVNTYRLAKGLRPLVLHPKLSQAAAAHSKDLAQRDEISHYGKDGSTPWARVERTGYRPRVAAENVGTGQISLREVLKGWKNSPSHNENLLLGDASHMGVALVHKPQSKLKTFWTLVLGSPLDGPSPVAATQSSRRGG